MRKLIVVAAVLVLVTGVVGLIAWFLWDRDRTASPSGRQQATSATPADAAPLPGNPIAKEQPAITARSEVASAPAPTPITEVTDPLLAEVRGRFLLPDGTPAAGVRVKVYAWEGNSERVLKFGRPENWQNPPVVDTGADGRFTIRFDPPRAFQFVLDTRLSGYTLASWRWSEIPPSSIKDIGDVTLLPAGTIEGRIVDASGKPITGQKWSVHGEGARTAQVDGADATRVHADSDPTTGAFILESAPPGLVQLKAQSRLAGWVEGPSIEVRAGEVTRADIVYRGPDNSRRITVTLFSRPFYVFEHEAEEIVLSGPGIESRRAIKIRGSSQSHTFDDVPPGRYTVEVRDPKFLSWRRENVAPGTEVRPNLEGSAAVKLEVVDAISGAVVEHYTARVRFDGVNFRPNVFEILGSGETPPAGGVFKGLIPVDQTLLITAEGYADCEVQAHGLEPNQVRTLQVRLWHGATLSGTVRQADRTPASGIDVALVPQPSADAESNRIRVILDDDQGVRSTRTGADGTFTITRVPAGTYQLRAGEAPLDAKLDNVLVSPDKDAIDDLELVLPAVGHLTGRLLAPDGARFDGLRIAVMPDLADERAAFEWVVRSHRSDTDADRVQPDGTFRVGPLPPGDAQVAVQLPGGMVPDGFSSSSGFDGGVIALGKVNVLGGADTKVEFDLRDKFPGHVRVSAKVNGSAAVSAIVEVMSEAGELLGACSVGADGTARIGPLPTGKARVAVRAIDHSWAYWWSDQVEVPVNGEASVALDIALVEGVVTVTRAKDHEPLKSHGVLIGPAGGDQQSWGVQVRSDDQGKVRLRLAPGRYEVRSAEGFAEHGTPLEWTTLGAAVPSVELEFQEFRVDPDDEGGHR